MEKLSVLVEVITREAEDIKSFVLTSVSGAELPRYTPGAHVDVHMGGGLVRQYSLCGSPQDRSRYMIGVKREPQSRGGSERMHGQLRVGDRIEISVPKNNFALDETADNTILLAGGIGITPIIAMADRLLLLGKSFELHYFGRTPQHTAFYKRLAQPEFAGKVHVHYGLDADAVRTKLEILLSSHGHGSHLYLCGPKPFMDMITTVAAQSWPPEAIHLEYFAADLAALAGPTNSFEVRLARSGESYIVPEDRSILQVLQEAGVDVSYSCEEGVCGTCMTGLLEGTPDHRDLFLSRADRAANTKMCLCVSRAKSSVLVLDI
ncbi:PDR/VanB family oxidoreductase [Aminobacter aganoensis]|uniref:Vanillate O-demethylase ferredoxin subunit n=1 Tax=Aminobacter aganoensis TaxID=83264 RepID=A0A7X0FDT0_9HYPH|nr:PDR/VanB family oxidoreductase [Aminobacter aganoensis]MBB6357924.1 vanillate O-demethylase ferredoxin subunit [Aminobacter aganoensis]